MSSIGDMKAENYWAKRDDLGREYYFNINHPSKPFIVNIIKKYNPKCVLEVGCASGDNIFLLSEQLKECDFMGIDINNEAIKFGNKVMEDRQARVCLTKAKAEDIGKLFGANRFDLVFTVGVLTHITPSKIKEVIDGIYKVSSKWIIFVEPYLPEGKLTKVALYHKYQWIRDYVKLMDKYEVGVPKITKISPELWSGEPWESLGTVLEWTKC